VGALPLPLMRDVGALPLPLMRDVGALPLPLNNTNRCTSFTLHPTYTSTCTFISRSECRQVLSASLLNTT